MMNWDDLRYVLSVARQKTLVGASRELGVDQTTVGRRLQAVEKALNTRLFDRVENRWIPTAAGVIITRRSEQIESQVRQAAVEIAGRDQNLSGPVRLTSVSLVVNHLLGPRTGELLERYPQIELELVDSQENLDLAHLEADIALRVARPTLPSAITRRVGLIKFHVYTAKKYAHRANELPWITFSEFKRELPETRWINKQLKGQKPLMRVSDATVMMATMPNLPCRALLPSAQVPHDSDLQIVSGPEPVVTRELWLVYMRALRNNERIKAVAEWATDICLDVLR